MSRHSLLNDFLTALGVAHTSEYTDRIYDSMTFKSLFGLSKALKSYGIPSAGYTLSQPSEILSLSTPFLARTHSGLFIIVTDINEHAVSYISYGQHESAIRDDVVAALDGTVFMAFPDKHSCEPSYRTHAFERIISRGRDIAIWLAPLLLVIIAGNYSGVWNYLSTTLSAVLYMTGIAVSLLLIKKTWHIKSAAADAVCGIVQHGGCDHVLESDGSKLFGVFSWSEIGLGYFSVSLVALIAFQCTWPWLAIFNICCLPYSFWSIWYQKYKARHWCTLCLTVQLTLWLTFFCWIAGSWIDPVEPLWHIPVMLLMAYVSVVCLLSGLTRLITRYTVKLENTLSSDNTQL